MADPGDERLLAVARHIAKTLGRTDTMTDDILHIFSTFDGRFSRENLSDTSSLDTLASLERQITHFLSTPAPIWLNSSDSSAFLDCADSLLALVPHLDPADPRLCDRANALVHQIVLQLEEEFRGLLENPETEPHHQIQSDSSNTDDDNDNDNEINIPVANPVTDYNIIIDAIPAGAASDLQAIARRMAAAGYGRECGLTFSAARRAFVEESIARLGLRCRTPDEVQATPWGDLEDEIPRWVKVVNVAFRVLYPSERRLSDRIFTGLSPIADFAFAELCRPSSLQLLGFADAVAGSSRAPERLFRVVDMYECVRELLTEVDYVFADSYSSSVRGECLAVYKSLGAAIRGIFIELENLIRRDPAKAPVPGGGLHPITRYVMNYLRAACVSRRTLEEVMEEEGGGAPVEPDRASSSLGVQIAWIMEVLQGNLEAKAKIYRDAGLSSVFLMNNGRYIMQKVRDSELSLLLGDDWIRRQMARVKKWSSDYYRTTWGKVVAVLRADPAAPPMGVKAMRERLRVFNGYLEEIERAQAGWVVADEQLKVELRTAAGNAVIPAYQGFLERLRAVAEGRSSEKHVKYSLEEVEERIRRLFEGKHGRR